MATSAEPRRDLQNKLHELQEKKRQMDELIDELRLLRQDEAVDRGMA